LLVALKAFGGMRQVARSITTETGAVLPWPTMDDTANMATIIGNENTNLPTDTDLVFSQKSIGAFTYASGPLPVSLQLLQDSAFDFGSIIEQAVVNRFGRKQNADFTTGAGTTLPYGVVTRAAAGTVGAAGQTTSITYADFVKLTHSVDPAYREGARFMFHDSVLQALKLLVDIQGRPLFVPSIAAGVPDTIASYPFTINQQMPVMAVNAKSVLFGNFSNYIIRDVLGMQMMVLRERFADNLQVAWLAYMRTSGELVSAASPIKYYANSAT
jgi:HK97 family phage major capsid protein